MTFGRYLAAITLLAAGLRLALTTLLYLNPDECMHFNGGSQGQWFLYHHPPLLFWWLWLVSQVSEGEAWLRLGPALAGALAATGMGFWVRRFAGDGTALAMAAGIAVSPNLVILTPQLRGYGFAMAAAVWAGYWLERSFAERSRRFLCYHLALLIFGILAEFVFAWVAVAFGLYGLWRFWREPAARRLLAPWLAGEGTAIALYAWLYHSVVRTLANDPSAPRLLSDYLREQFPQAGEAILVFLGKGILAQLSYVTGGWASGLLALLLAATALWRWAQSREPRWILVAGLYSVFFGAIARFFPFGLTRHTAVLGVLSLLAVAAGLEQLQPRLRWLALAAIVGLSALFPARDPQKIPLSSWQRARMEKAWAAVADRLPDSAALLADEESALYIRAKFHPRGQRQAILLGRGKTTYRGREVQVSPRFDWSQQDIPAIRALAQHAGSDVWIVDTGFRAGSIRARSDQLGLETVVDEPGVLYLGRFR